jgi:hypothetical protein
MIIVRILGIALLLAAIAVVGVEVGDLIKSGIYRSKAAGELWFELHPNSLQLAQPAIQRYLHPAIWERGIQPLLLLPASAVIAVTGFVIYLIGWFLRKRRRRVFHS